MRVYRCNKFSDVARELVRAAVKDRYHKVRRLYMHEGRCMLQVCVLAAAFHSNHHICWGLLEDAYLLQPALLVIYVLTCCLCSL